MIETINLEVLPLNTWVNYDASNELNNIKNQTTAILQYTYDQINGEVHTLKPGQSIPFVNQNIYFMTSVVGIVVQIEKNVVATHPVSTSKGIKESAWNIQKVSIDKSMAHGLWTFDIPRDYWKKLKDGVEILDGSVDTQIRSENFNLVLESKDNARYTLRSLRHPRYQPNRGHLWSDSSWIPNATNGTLSVVRRSMYDGVVTDTVVQIADILSYDLTKGNIHDIQFQWRGVGDYKYFMNLNEILKESLLGTLDKLSIGNPALSIMYEAVKGSHTLGGVLRPNSCVRFGLGTEEHGVFFEYQYADDSDAILKAGCVDITSEGGQKEAVTFASATSDLITMGTGDEEPVLVVRVPNTREVLGSDGNLYTAYNTRDLILTVMNFRSNDEQIVRLYGFRDPSRITATWEVNQSNDLEFAYGGTDGTITAVDLTGLKSIFTIGTDTDQPITISNSNGENGEMWLTSGQYLLITTDAFGGGGDNIIATLRLGSEK